MSNYTAPYKSPYQIPYGTGGKSSPWDGIYYFWEFTSASNTDSVSSKTLDDSIARSVPATTGLDGDGSGAKQMGNPTPDTFGPHLGALASPFDTDHDFTLYAWSKAVNVTTQDCAIMGIMDSTKANGGTFSVRLDDWAGWVASGNTSPTVNFGLPSARSTSVWDFACIRWDSAAGEMTVGWNSEVAKVTNNTVANMPFGSGTYIFIGGVSSLSAAANKVGNGHIDKFAYFTRRLTDEEVTHHYNGGSGRTYLEE